MRLIRIGGLAAIAAFAAMAFIGASASSAGSFLCEKNVTVCPEAERLSVGSELQGLTLEKGGLSLLLVNKEIKEECGISVLGELKSNTPVQVLITSLTYYNCVGICKKVAENIPYLLEGVASEHMAFLKEDGKGKPAILLSECLFGAECLYEQTAASQLLDATNSELVALGMPLTKKTHANDLFCPSSETTLDASILLSLDKKPETMVFLTE